jgi:hypothetical protein
MHIDDGNDKNTLDVSKLLKKMCETEKYFLIPEIKLKTTDFYYQNLEKKYLERKEKINN